MCGGSIMSMAWRGRTGTAISHLVTSMRQFTSAAPGAGGYTVSGGEYEPCFWTYTLKHVQLAAES